jgi:hypothetical protein
MLLWLQPGAITMEGEEEVEFVASTAPEDLRAEWIVARKATANAGATNLLAGVALNLPSRGIVSA